MYIKLYVPVWCVCVYVYSSSKNNNKLVIKHIIANKSNTQEHEKIHRFVNKIHSVLLFIILNYEVGNYIYDMFLSIVNSCFV